MRRRNWIIPFMVMILNVLSLSVGYAGAAVDNTAPAKTVRLIFIHHSTGGNWLADANQDMPYGELGKQLMNNNYYVSATNYGWGPDDIGSRTDIVNWPEWFVGTDSADILSRLYSESGQNVGDFGAWPRLSAAPDGENTIIMFKSCFPNSDLYGEGTDEPASTVSDAYTVSNGKAIYNQLLSYFATRQDKLFVVITAPPQNESEYGSDYQTPAKRAENARAFNNWLVNDWLSGYAYANVAVFDYFNVLTASDNHHRISNGAVEHVTNTNYNFAAYPTASYDSHPNSEGQQKATSEFVPLLNYFYNRWTSGGTINDGDDDIDDNGTGTGDEDNQVNTGDTADQTCSNSGSNLIQPEDLTYMGAFRLPEGSNGVNWSYTAGDGMTYYPKGDADGTNDGYRGSIFATCFDPEPTYSGETEQRNPFVSEISIPVPVISNSKDVNQLNTAGTLQPFQDIGIPNTLIIGRIGLSYLPAQGDQTADKLYFCYGEHIQGNDYSHGWTELNLSAPASQGPWKFGSYANYVTNDYLFEIPKTWADSNTPGQLLATGRIREGLWSGRGPALYAYGPWNDGNPPQKNATLQSITPLLLYGTQEPGAIDITSDENTMMNGYSVSDDWSGGSWLTAGTKSAVAFIGTKAVGNAWYGFANGVVWDYECAEHNPPDCPDVPNYPYDDRGYWADDFKAKIIFYDPDDLAAVVKGNKQTCDPQPYASIDLDKYLFDPNTSPQRAKRLLVGAMCFDGVSGLIYVFERMADGVNGDEKGLIHVFKLACSSSSTNTPGDDNDDSNTGTDDTATGDDDSGSSEDDSTHNSGGSGGGGCFIDNFFN